MAYRRTIVVNDEAVTGAVRLTARQALVPNLLVTILFFLWGFAYGLLDVLNQHFQATLHISSSMAAGLSSAYFGAYFVCPPTISGWLLRRAGFRATFMAGLAVLAVGCLLFWPSGLHRSFGGFCGSMFVVGAGLSTLETAADPFLAICGPPRHSEIRLNLGQAVQGVGAFVAPLLASRVFFASTVDTMAGLRNVQWVYLGVAGFVVLLILLFLLVPMPEITDADMCALETAVEGQDILVNSDGVPIPGSVYDTGPFVKQYNLFLAVWAQFCYVGAQVAVANYFIQFCVESGRDSANGSDLLAIAQGLYAVNRFVAGFLLLWPFIKPRILLAIYLSFCLIFIIAAITTRGTTSIVFLTLVLCAESACFATIFTLGLRGLGRHTKIGGSLLVAGISGGMVFPAMTGAIVDRHGAHKAMTIPMMGYALALLYPLYVNLWQRERMDRHRTAGVGVRHGGGGDTEAAVDDKPDRLRAHAQAFDGLLSLIPAKLYYGNGDEPSEQWRRKKQTKAEKQAARRANLDPENALNKSVKEVLEERAASSKRKLAAITGAGTNGEPDDSKDAGDVEGAEGGEKAGNDDDDDEDDGSSVDGIVKEKPGEGLKKAKAKAKTAEVGETASKKAKLSNGEENEETDNKMGKKEGEDEDENGDDDDYDDDDGGGIRLEDANLSAKQQKKLLKKQAKAERRAEKRKSKAKKTEPREKAADIVDEAPKDAVKEDIKDTEEQQENGENNDDVDGHDNASAADNLNDTSFAALAAEQDAPSSPSAASSVASPIFDTTLLTADDAADADADADAAATTATTTSSVSSTATTTTIAPDQKHKISVPADTAALRARLAAKIEALRAARKADAARMTRDADGQLVVISTRQQLIEARRQKQAERKQHKKELRRAAREEEERQREAAVLLKKALKRKEQAKKKSAKAWAERIEGVARAGQERQAKRQANLRARREDKQLHRAGLSKKAKKGSKSGSGKGRPGFEGTFGGRRK
ncbi:glucose galactose transporter [Niveomyces insectorum RCEF 264]|uniref:Glucose galactose transporter n=1 Tax=Niveomyces insectorum RCEF 264 TaxID=1081102 RepID=A0A167SR22_9HYPO|nr:glucose galactose transporter [Niveomyces insectorum RCEF 264]